MRKIYTLILGILITSVVVNAQTAVNFTVNDCAGNPHTLFTELDAGTVVVIDWVMPCASCVAPSLTAYNVVQSFESSHPGRVKRYIVDDYANSTCSTIQGWANNNNMPNCTFFSNAAIKMTDYGSAGMPKVVVLGGTSHTVFFNQNNTVNGTQLQNAINNALNSTAVNEINNLELKLSVYPVPIISKTSIQFILSTTSDVKIEFYNLLGDLVKSISKTDLSAGRQKIELEVAELNAGIYFVKLITNHGFEIKKVSIAN